jgi:hypothetical protein
MDVDVKTAIVRAKTPAGRARLNFDFDENITISFQEEL